MILHGDCSQTSRRIEDLELGKAAEHLVCADLILKGYRAFLSDQGLPYDVVADIDNRLIRIQVKATSKLRSVPQRRAHTPSYLWHVRRSGRKGRRQYLGTEFELLALVAVDIKAIAYCVINERVKQTVHLRHPGTPKTSKLKVLRNIDEYSFEDALAEVKCG